MDYLHRYSILPPHHVVSASAFASACILCRASQHNAQGESLVALAKEGFKALYCLCMHDRCF